MLSWICCLALMQSPVVTQQELVPQAAREIAAELVDQLRKAEKTAPKAEKTGEGKGKIQAFAFSHAIGDVDGVLRDELLNRLLSQLGLERIAEREERARVIGDYYRKDGFERGLYDLSRLKSLGGKFLDNEGVFGARVSFSQEGGKTIIHASAELIDVQRMAHIWTGTAQRVHVPQSMIDKASKSELESLLSLKLLKDSRRRIELRLVDLGDVDAKKRLLALDRKEAADRAQAREDKAQAREDAKDRKSALGILALWVVGVGGVLVLFFYGIRMRRRPIAQAQARGSQALERVQEKNRDETALSQGARRSHAAAERVAKGANRAPEATRSILTDLSEDLRGLARTFENAPRGAFDTPVEGSKDLAVERVRRLADHDAATVALLEELESEADRLASANGSTEDVGTRSAVAAALADKITKRLGDRPGI